MTITVIKRSMSDAGTKGLVQAFFTFFNNRTERDFLEHASDRTHNDPEFLHKYNTFRRLFVSTDHLLIAPPRANQGSLQDVLFVRHQWFLLTRRTANVATLNLQDFVHGGGGDGRVEVVVCTSFKRTIELMEESQARGDHLFVPTAAGAA